MKGTNTECLMHAGNKSNLISFILLSILEGTFIPILQIRQPRPEWSSNLLQGTLLVTMRLGLQDLQNRNTGHPTEFEFQINNEK